MSPCLISGKKYSLDLAQYIIWSEFHIQTIKKKKSLKEKTHTDTRIHTVGKK